MLERRRGVVQNGIDAGSDGVRRRSRPPATKIDRQHSEITRLCGDGPNEPEVPFAIVDHAPVARRGTAGGQPLGLLPDPFRHLIRARQGGAAARPGFEQNRAMADDRGQVLADGDVDVACRMGGSEPARERVKVLHLGFTAARQIGLLPEIGRQMTGHDRDEDEERELDQMLRIVHKKAVYRRVEEEC